MYDNLALSVCVFLEAEPLFTHLCLSVRLPACPSNQLEKNYIAWFQINEVKEIINLIVN